MGMPGTVHADHWRWRLDNGGEGSGGAGWHEAEDTLHDFPTGELDVNVRLRFSIHVEAGPVDDVEPQIQYNLNTVGWNDITASSSVARVSASGNFTDGDDTTEHGVTFVGTGSFITNNDGMDDGDGVAGALTNDLTAQDYEALEYCFQLREADLADNDSIEFRLVRFEGPQFTSYPTPHANCTIDLPAGGLSIPVAQASYRRQHERGR